MLKLALREADRVRPERLQEAAHRALEQHARRSFSEPTLRTLAQSESQGDLFGASDTAQAGSPAEGEFLAGCNLANASARSAFENALSNEVDSYVREMRATLVAEGARDVSEVMRAVTGAFDAALPNVVDSMCGGEASSPNVPNLSIEENLLPPGPRRAS